MTQTTSEEIEKWIGPKCPDYDEECFVCRSYKAVDVALKEYKEELKREINKRASYEVISIDIELLNKIMDKLSQ